jgi:hypothetical protein
LVVLVSEFGADLMARGETFFVDGTFDTTECKLVLTVMMTLVGEVAVPCAYLLSDSRETDTYETFFKVLLLRTIPSSVLRLSISLLYAFFFPLLISGYW